MVDTQPIQKPRSPFVGMALADVPEVARMQASPDAAHFVLRTDGRAARALTLAIGLPLPPSINRFEASASGGLVMQLGPDEWVVLVPGGDAQAIADKAEAARANNGSVFAFVDISHRMATLEIAGPSVVDVLAAGCPLPLDMHRFSVGRATRTIFHKAEILLWRTAVDRFHVACNRSFLAYLTQHLAEVIRAEAALAKRDVLAG